MVQHVKLARERRKRKSRIRAFIFFFALLSIITGGILSLKDKESNTETGGVQYQALHPVQPSAQSEQSQQPQNENLAPKDTAVSANSADSTDSANSVAKNSEKASEKATENTPEDDATSYDDELSDVDDEVDQIADQDKLPDDAQSAVDNLLDAADQAKRITDQFTHTIVRGDKLKDVLEMSGLEDETSQKLIASYPELKNLKAGQQIYWILDNENELEYLNWLVSEKEERIYERKSEGKFARQILEKKSIWKKEVLKGQLAGSLRASLQKLGLDNRQISQLSTALQWQVDVAKLGKDSKFALLVSREYLGDKLTGQGNVEAIHIISNGKSYYAIQADNGRYYNRQGETIGKGFARLPLQRQARISSHFNPGRRHPVTGKVRPHKGTDFAIPTGTPIIAPADALVEKVAYQRGGAGIYVVLRHGREYQTIYMHLSKSLVRAGQSVKRGERIALSGNTGISTGPHLHYEFHINGRPVNAMTVRLPGVNAGMSVAERKAFLVKAKQAEGRLRM